MIQHPNFPRASRLVIIADTRLRKNAENRRPTRTQSRAGHMYEASIRKQQQQQQQQQKQKKKKKKVSCGNSCFASCQRMFGSLMKNVCSVRSEGNRICQYDSVRAVELRSAYLVYVLLRGWTELCHSRSRNLSNTRLPFGGCHSDYEQRRR